MKGWIVKMGVTLPSLLVCAVAGSAPATAATPGFPVDGVVPSGVASAASADGSTVVVGDPATGKLLVYARPAGGWGAEPVEPAVVQATNARNGERFGSRVEITDNGDRILTTTAPVYPGAAMVFQRPAGGWSSGSYTGWRAADLGYGAVALSGDGSTLALSGPARDRVVVYNRDVSANYYRQGTYMDELPTGDAALSRSGDVLVVSQVPGDATYTDFGRSDAVMVPRPAIGWSYQTRPYPYQLQQFGDSLPGYGSDVAVSADGGTVAVGADGGGAGAGAVVVYSHDQWTSTQPYPDATLTAGETVAGLGAQVAVSADGGTVAATGTDPLAGGPVAGIFVRSDPLWTATGEAAAVVSAAEDAGAGWRIHLAGNGRGLFVGGDGALTHHLGDTLGPQTSPTTAPELPGGRDGWHVAPVSFAVAADDGPTGAGIAEVRCALDPATAPESFADLPAGPCPGSALATATGAHEVYAAAVDFFGNVGELETIDFRLDAVPPRLSLPAAITVDAPTQSGTNVQYTFGSSDDYAPVAPVVCAPAPGAFFPVGTSTVRCNAIDQAGNVTEGTFDVTVRPGSGRGGPPEEKPPGEEPPRSDPPVVDPPGTVAPGTVPPGTVAPGTVPPGTVAPGTVPPGTAPTGGEKPPGSAPSRDVPPSSGPERGGGRPARAALRLSSLAVRNRTLTVRVSAAARLQVELARCRAAAGGRVVCRTAARASASARRAGVVRLALPARLPAGSYRVTVRASGDGANATPIVRTIGLARPRR